MYIPISLATILGVLGVALIILATPYRQAFIDILSAFWNVICGTASRIWAFLRGAAPIPGATSNWLGTTLMFLLLAIILFSLFVFFILSISILTVGITTGNLKAALVLLAMLLLWRILSRFSKISGSKPLQWTSDWVVRPLVMFLSLYMVIAFGWWAFGNFSPRLHESINRSTGDHIGELANSLDKGSLQSEPEAGIFAYVSKDCRVYNSGNQAFTSLKENDLIYVLNTDGKPKTTNGEGMTQIMLPNQDGDFVGGKRGWIPSRIINWDKWDKTEISKKDNPGIGSVVDIKKSTLIDTVRIDYPPTPRKIAGILPPGNYLVEFNPVEAIDSATIRIMLSETKFETRRIKGNKFSIKSGEKGIGIGSSISSIVSIYVQ